MNRQRKSDRSVVPEKPSNKAGGSAAEVVEGRGLGKRNVAQQNAHRTQSRGSAHSALNRVRQAARKDRKAKFTALMHHLTVEQLRAAFLELKREAAPGIDGVTWEQYEVALEENLRGLHQRLHSGAYRAKPSRRTYIPKADGRLRPLGVASLEDKLVQRAVVEVLNAIYEEDFLGFSYGFRPGRSQHDALDALAAGIQRKKVNWVLDADIRGFFDAIDHGCLMKFVEHRVVDPRVLRLIQKWLNAGVMEDGKRAHVQVGTPQGATVSPLLGNIYLHYAFDQWARQWRTRKASGDVIVVRYADDFIVGFQHRKDAEQFQRELRERLQKFSLELHPEKTRLIEFGRYAAERREEHGMGKPETFDFLGFTHMCGKSGDKNSFVLLRRTIKKRLRAKLLDVKHELKRRRHDSIREQGQWLGTVVRGYFAYHAVPTNYRALEAFRREALRHWRKTLIRRGQKGRMPWSRMGQLAQRYIPKAKIQHPWPYERFDDRTQAKSRMR
jgi:group II intron reverse transcriptase/maturase